MLCITSDAPTTPTLIDTHHSPQDVSPPSAAAASSRRRRARPRRRRRLPSVPDRGGHRRRHPARLQERQPHLQAARPLLPRPHRAPQPAPPRRHRGQPRRARAGGARRRRAPAAVVPPRWPAPYGVPVLLKDNIATRDRLNTTAGSLALLGSVARRDAGVVRRLRRAGAVVLGKANLDEWANFRTIQGTGGWSARGGQGRNPYVLSAAQCGSSTGSAIAAAANMAAATLGTETDGSILCPSSLNSVVGIKPTVGLTSRAGVVPISPRQDTIGPICRTVADAVQVLDAIVSYDSRDAKATRAASKYIPPGGYVQFLKPDGLKGKRIGIPNGFFNFPSGTVQQIVYQQLLDTVRKQGAVVIENLDIANLTVIQDVLNNGQQIVLPAEFKSSLNTYLSDLSYSPVRSLAEIIAFNDAHPIEVMKSILLLLL
ncbi:hypothetical protein DAI22_06g110800 [Oryza sativa Japonica Group]|nr:hypothetical protein DAI22_06g110800 [Oryza sativa Japonica Group]